MHPLQFLVDQDWTPRNLIALQRAIRSAYSEVNDHCDPKRRAYFSTPNRAYGLGYNRWLAIDYYLKEACDSGRFEGITGEWVALRGKRGMPLKTMELRGKNTSVLAVHLNDADDTPRDSDYRSDKRASNERHPLLTGFVDPHEPQSSDTLLSLLLVHGDKLAEFAELRAYDDEENQASYTSFSPNLMLGAALVSPTESEPVTEPKVAFIQPNQIQARPQAGA